MTVLKCSSKAGMNEFSCWKVSAVTLPPAAVFALLHLAGDDARLGRDGLTGRAAVRLSQA